MSSASVRHRNIAQQRRSQRVLLSVPPLVVVGKRDDNSAFSERTTTSVVNGRWCRLQERVRMGQILQLKNVSTGEEFNCTVVDINPSQHEGAEAGVEFVEPCPRFWHVAFPAVGWSQRSPEAKRVRANPANYPASSLKK